MEYETDNVYMKSVTLLLSDLNSSISLLKSRKTTIALAYTFTFTFITCTFFLPFNPFSTSVSIYFYPLFPQNLTEKVQFLSPNNSSTPQNLTVQAQNLTEKVQFSSPNNSSFLRRNVSVDNVEKKAKERAVIYSLGVSLVKKEKVNKHGENRKDYNVVESSFMKCDFYDGKWVKDESYPLYNPRSCSLIDEQFNCHKNGRPDNDHHKLKWKPKGCTLPRLNGIHMLEMLRGKRVVFVGDSLNRNMWESLICILKNSVKDQTKVYEASGRRYFRSKPSYSFVFEDYAFTLEFFVSPFLVQEWEMQDNNTKSKKETLRLDLMQSSAKGYSTADILIFNTGHWWTHEKTSKGEGYYQEGDHVYDKLDALEAFRKALTTWGRWVDANVNQKNTQIFFRGYSSSHFRGGQWNSGGQCDNETEPIIDEKFLIKYPEQMTVLEKVLKKMKTRVSFLNITKMTDYRKDGHPSIYSIENVTETQRLAPRIQDCSHWCLPGVPDAWNELLYAEILRKNMKDNILFQQSVNPSLE